MPEFNKEEFVKEWIHSLNSGKYEQGKGVLRTAIDEYCCLGVACDLLSKKGIGEWVSTKEDANYFYKYRFEMNKGVLPENIAILIGLPLNQLSVLAGMNDSGTSFKKISKHIEEIYADKSKL